MKIAVIAICLALCGCVSQKTLLANPSGQVLHCDGWGFGLIGVPVALASHADCMKKAHEAGYSEAPIASK
jgi:hypothetical protein